MSASKRLSFLWKFLGVAAFLIVALVAVPRLIAATGTFTPCPPT